ncbi:MAG: CRISPR-associated endonuclease Cas4g/Cas1g [Thermoplasmataceae archaeon]
MNDNRTSDLLPARMLNEFVYCNRLFYLEYVQCDFRDSAETIEGRSKHRNVDKESGDLPPPPDHGEETDKDLRIHAKSVLLSDEKHGLIARLDLLEGTDADVIPVEYKKGNPPETEDHLWPSDKAQVCAQGIILRENGYKCSGGVVYYFGSKQRINVEFTDELIFLTLSYVEAAKALLSTKKMPLPLVDSPKCPKCSLVGICLPDETISLLNQEKKIDNIDVRRLYPSRDDSLPVYVMDQGATVTKRNEELEIKQSGKILGRAKLMETSQLSIFGNVQVTTQTIQELCRRGIPICYFSFGGWFNGMTQGVTHKNVGLRIAQYDKASDPNSALILARGFIQGKIKNCRTLLKRNLKVPAEKALEELKKFSDLSTRALDLQTLLGIEGSAARVYFMHFADMLKTEKKEDAFDFESRNRRPPTDPVNALLSYLYAILAKDLTITLMSVGLDPYRGFLHQPHYGHPALALDLMEEFRPLISDSTVIGLINNNEVSENDFIRRGNSVLIKDTARRTVIRAYERRMDTLVTHPFFGYSISYRRNLEVQARLLGRTLLNEIPEYPIFYTR